MEWDLSVRGGVYARRDLWRGAGSVEGVVYVQRGGVGRCLCGAGPVWGGPCAAGGAVALAETVFAPAAVAAVGGWAERRGAGRPGWRRPGAAGGSEEECTGGLRRWNGFGEPGSVEPKELR